MLKEHSNVAMFSCLALLPSPLPAGSHHFFDYAYSNKKETKIAKDYQLAIYSQCIQYLGLCIFSSCATIILKTKTCLYTPSLTFSSEGPLMVDHFSDHFKLVLFMSSFFCLPFSMHFPLKSVSSLRSVYLYLWSAWQKVCKHSSAHFCTPCLHCMVPDAELYSCLYCFIKTETKNTMRFQIGEKSLNIFF